MMRFYMVAGDVVAASKGEMARPTEPEAIFCWSSTSHHSTWLRLPKREVRWRIERGSGGEIAPEELNRALLLIAEHRVWQADVIKRRGYWKASAEELRRSRKAHAAKSAAVVEAAP